MKTLRASLLAAAALGLAAPAQATVFTFQTTLLGANEVPPVASPGSGESTVVYDDVAHLLDVEVSFADLLAPTADAHIHCCAPPGVAVGVAVGFTPAGFPLGVTAGDFSHVFNLTDPAIYTANFLNANGGTAAGAEAALAAALFDGLTYVNVHSTMFPGGEIRGQLAEVAEPATLGLLLAGLAGLAARRRR